MSINQAILGFLSWDQASGYDLKKRFAASPTHYWSGNNNQIYTALVQLHKKGLVTREIQPQESLPARKIYSITPAGRETLREWVLSKPEAPQLKNSFLTQLAWADQLEAAELDQLLAEYDGELEAELLMLQEIARRGRPAPDRTPRETFLWEMLLSNQISFYENERLWVSRLRQGLETLSSES